MQRVPLQSPNEPPGSFPKHCFTHYFIRGSERSLFKEWETSLFALRISVRNHPKGRNQQKAELPLLCNGVPRATISRPCWWQRWEAKPGVAAVKHQSPRNIQERCPWTPGGQGRLLLCARRSPPSSDSRARSPVRCFAFPARLFLI